MKIIKIMNLTKMILTILFITVVYKKSISNNIGI